METKRTILQKKLEDFLETKNVYFQPPESFKLKYPCVIYNLASTFPRFANNELYFDKDQYRLEIIDRNPDSALFQKMKRFRYARFERPFVANNLHHWVFNIYF